MDAVFVFPSTQRVQPTLGVNEMFRAKALYILVWETFLIQNEKNKLAYFWLYLYLYTYFHLIDMCIYVHLYVCIYTCACIRYVCICNISVIYMHNIYIHVLYIHTYITEQQKRLILWCNLAVSGADKIDKIYIKYKHEMWWYMWEIFNTNSY